MLRKAQKELSEAINEVDSIQVGIGDPNEMSQIFGGFGGVESKLVGGVKHFLFLPRKLGKMIQFDSYFSGWVETTNQKTL